VDEEAPAGEAGASAALCVWLYWGEPAAWRYGQPLVFSIDSRPVLHEGTVAIFTTFGW